MKPITFENLRRLVGGGRKKKDKECSFKRSDSFKRISIRKSYLDRGKKKHISKLEVATQTVTEEELLAETKKVDSSCQVDRQELNAGEETYKKPEPRCNTKYKVEVNSEHSVVAYGQWLNGIRKDDHPCHSGIKGSERTIIYVPASDERPPSPVIRQLSSSPVFRKKPSPVPKKRVSPNLQRKESNDSAVEMFPWGDSTDVKKSPLVRRRSRHQSPPLMPDSGTEELCSLSISLGRVWMDAPQVMAPRSLELPKSSNPPPPAHHSLDSALKDLREDPIVMNRLQKRPTPPVARTLSSTSNTTASTGLFSSKDSGFSFSISDFHANFAPSSKGFFRKKRPKPKLSVSRDGYFKRTSGALAVDPARNSVKRRSSRKKKGKKSKKNGTVKSDLYQVVVGRPAKSLRTLKLDPMIFVPPEKRKAKVSRKPSFGVNEIRHLNPVYNKSDEEGTYESLPRSYEDHSGRMSRLSLREEELENFEYVSEESAAESDYEGSSKSSGSRYVPPGVSPVPRRKPARQKKKSLAHKRSITYLVKPNIIRAPSTLKRPTKKTGKKAQMHQNRPD
ncbi:unnamed protein product [Acanthoscelides obtectus]|uniref:Uncharacterized protein n=1 Tax=Acanthoscelides obtectus TaxID=200917 RepID=A0A9P0MD67_ACAOB|nr:unnamed protein product [Acanthoscelides obtectus]CAK1675901.1 hypothetical protein AOBTE_LOCUS30478 [Acanthoscelides obtectus]